MKKIVAAFVFLLFFSLYIFLAFPSLSSFRDAGDLALAASSLGIAHPPGYPTYVLLGHAFQSLVPFANPAYRLNIFSSLCGAGTIALLFIFLRAFHGTTGAIFGSLMAGVLSFVMAQSGLSEIYALNALFAVTLFGGAFCLSQGSSTHQARLWILLVYVGGLGLGNHQSLLLVSPVFLVFLWRNRTHGIFTPRFWGACALAMVFGLSIYLFLPFRAHAGAHYVWGEPAHFSGLWNILTRADYGAGTLSTRYSTASAVEGLATWLFLWKSQWGILGTLLTIAAGGWCLKKGPRETWGIPVLTLWFVTGPLFALLARMKPGELADAILLPTLVVPGLAAAGGVGLMVGSWTKKTRPLALGALAVCCLFILTQGLPSISQQNQRKNTVAWDYGKNLLRTLPLNGVLLMITDAAIFSVVYHQGAAMSRSDLSVLVDVKLPWRWQQYRRRFPHLFQEGQKDGGLELARALAGKGVLFTEGMQAALVDTLCPRGMGAQVEWPQRGKGCADKMEKNIWLWDLYVRRPPDSSHLSSDYYTQDILKTAAAGAYNAKILLSQARRERSAKEFYRKYLSWKPHPASL